MRTDEIRSRAPMAFAVADGQKRIGPRRGMDHRVVAMVFRERCGRAPEVDLGNLRGHRGGTPDLSIGDRLDATRIVVRGAVDVGTHRPSGHGFRWIRSERNLRAGEPGAERVRL